MTEIYLHFLFAHYGLYGNAPVLEWEGDSGGTAHSHSHSLPPLAVTGSVCLVGPNSACRWLCVSLSFLPRLSARGLPVPAPFLPSCRPCSHVRSLSRHTIDSTGASPDNPYCAHVKMKVNISHACFHNYGLSGNAPVRGATRPRPRLTYICPLLWRSGRSTLTVTAVA